MKEKLIKEPVRLNKKETLTLEYEKATVYKTGTLFITILVILAFRMGTENSSLIWSCI